MQPIPLPAFLRGAVSLDQWHTILGLWQAHTKSVAKGEFLVQAGDEVTHIYVVIQGMLHLGITDYWGNEALMGQVAEGHLFGAAYAFGHTHHYMVSAQAAGDSMVLAIPVATIETSLTQHAQLVYPVYRQFLTAMADRSIALLASLQQVKQRTLRQKVLAYLSYLSREQNSLRVVCPLGRQQMADYLGVDRSALSRELSSLAAEGKLHYRKNIFVLSPEP